MAAKKAVVSKIGVDLPIRNNGLEVQVWDGSSYLGRLYVQKTGLVWCAGKTKKPNGAKRTWERIAKWK